MLAFIDIPYWPGSKLEEEKGQAENDQNRYKEPFVFPGCIIDHLSNVYGWQVKTVPPPFERLLFKDKFVKLCYRDRKVNC